MGSKKYYKIYHPQIGWKFVTPHKTRKYAWWVTNKMGETDFDELIVGKPFKKIEYELSLKYPLLVKVKKIKG